MVWVPIEVQVHLYHKWSPVLSISIKWGGRSQLGWLGHSWSFWESDHSWGPPSRRLPFRGPSSWWSFSWWPSFWWFLWWFCWDGPPESASRCPHNKRVVG